MYQSELQKLKEHDHRTHQTGLVSQFDLLFQLTPNPDDIHCDTAEVNSDKNRSDKFLPREDCRTMNCYYWQFYIAEKFLVTLQETKETKGYIHASFLNVS